MGMLASVSPSAAASPVAAAAAAAVGVTTAPRPKVMAGAAVLLAPAACPPLSADALPKVVLGGVEVLPKENAGFVAVPIELPNEKDGVGAPSLGARSGKNGDDAVGAGVVAGI